MKEQAEEPTLLNEIEKIEESNRKLKSDAIQIAALNRQLVLQMQTLNQQAKTYELNGLVKASKEIENHKNGKMETASYLWEMLKLSTPKGKQLSGEITTTAAKADHLASLIGRNSDAADFLDWGGELAGYGPRYVKYSDKVKEHGFEKGDRYIGEWSVSTKKPCGRGIRLNNRGWITIRYWKDSEYTDGRFINIDKFDECAVGEQT